MIGALTWRLGAFALAGLLVVVSVAALFDGVRLRTAISIIAADRDEARAQLKTANENIGTCHANVGTLANAVDSQGADIRKLAETSQAATAEAARRQADIAKDAKAAREASQRVLARPLPLPDLACMEAARLLRGGT